MTNILLLCEMGASTSILEGRMNDYAKDNGLDVSVDARSMHDIERILKGEKKIDYILLGPQVSYKKANFVEKYGGYNIPIDTISFDDYAMMNGEGVVKRVMEALAKNGQ